MQAGSRFNAIVSQQEVAGRQHAAAYHRDVDLQVGPAVPVHVAVNDAPGRPELSSLPRECGGADERERLILARPCTGVDAAQVDLVHAHGKVRDGIGCSNW